MTYNDPTHWRGRAEDLRVLAERMKDGISKHMMRRMADDYESLARTVEQRPERFRFVALVPPEARLFGHRRTPVVAVAPDRIRDFEMPNFLKRGPATAEEVGAPVAPATGHWVDPRNSWFRSRGGQE